MCSQNDSMFSVLKLSSFLVTFRNKAKLRVIFNMLRTFVMLPQFAKRRYVEHIVKLTLLLC
jgi:hypothetical protein